MENRSFDRMMGWFKYSDAIDGLTGKEFNYQDARNTSSPKIFATNRGLLKDPLDPPHGYAQVAAQISGDVSVRPDGVTSAPMSGFVQGLVAAYPEIAGNATAMQQAMDGFDPSTIPITYELASNYTIIDRWFSSFPGSTMPNRMFIHSATSHGEVNTTGSKYILGYPQRTIYHNLEDAGIEWKNYYELVPSLIVFNKLRAGSLGRYKNWGTFSRDAAAGTLPPVSFIDPAYFSIAQCIPEDDNHPPADVAQGERLLKEVYETLRASPNGTTRFSLLLMTR
ncbi:phosphoesterase [Dichotomocladium elegans]|nr:phosphoesterase [Dichotomocladium elegans]